ncbi:MAG: bifunctional adenosylcobinamide kinase/adenosylcobinamide-phosphate guanylyltransferase [Rhodoferax sp.]
MTVSTIVRSELILGGQKSGKSRRAELLARQWLGQGADHRAVLIATAQPWDDEMRARIARHQADRAERVPGMATVEEPLALAQAITQHSTPQTLLVVDCLTLWLTNLLMPSTAHEHQPHQGRRAECFAQVKGERAQHAGDAEPNTQSFCPIAPVNATQNAMLLVAIQQALGPVVLVGNEIGLGVIPLGREVRAFVDALGRLNQDVAAVCQRVTLMAAGLPLLLKNAP